MYQRMLIAIDLTEAASQSTLECTRAAADDQTQMCVVHVVEPQYVQYSVDPTITGSMTHELEETAVKNATERLGELCEPAGIEPQNQYVRLGRAAHEIHALATELDADVIVVGSHGRHGWRRVLGSTANAVLHGTPVDTLVAHVPAK